MPVESKELCSMVATLAGPQFLAGFPKGQSLNPVFLFIVNDIPSFVDSSVLVLMMLRFIDQLDVKRTTYNSNMIYDWSKT